MYTVDRIQKYTVYCQWALHLLLSSHELHYLTSPLYLVWPHGDVSDTVFILCKVNMAYRGQEPHRNPFEAHIFCHTRIKNTTGSDMMSMSSLKTGET